MKKVFIAVLMLVGLSASFVAMADDSQAQQDQSSVGFCVGNTC